MRNFRTSDIYLAGYLRSSGYKLIGYSQHKGKMWYSFPGDPTITAEALAYGAGAAVTCPKKLRDNIRDIKSMVNKGKKTVGTV